MTRQTILALTLLTLVVMGNSIDLNDRQRVDRLVRKLMQCAKIPALGIALVGFDDRSLYKNAYGSMGPKFNQRANIDTSFCLGGATEAFTAVLLAKLINENENVTWSTPIQNIVGHRVTLSDTYSSGNLNLKDILAKRTGYPNMDIVPFTKPFSSARLTRNLRYLQPIAGFRETFVPNQIMFSLLEEVVDDLTQESWEDLIREQILRPLGMNSVVFVGHKNNDDATNLANPVVFYDDKQQTLSMDALKGLKLIRQAASLCLSATDMSKWMRFLMDGKGANGQPLMDMKVLRETFKGVQARGHSKDPQISGYRQPDVDVTYAREQNALGWITGHYRGHHFVSQDGSIPGIQTLATILPDARVAVFTSFTGKGGSQGLAAKTLINEYGLDILLKEKTSFTEHDVCQKMERMKNLHAEVPMKHQNVHRTSKYQGERSIDDFVGYYRNYAYGNIFVKHNHTEDLDLLMEYGDAVYRMVPTNMNNTFQLIAMGRLWYTTNADSPRKNHEKIIAVFSEDSRDPKRRIRDVNISGFDKSGDVLFSHNPTPPRYGGSHQCHCGASAMTSAVSLLISFLFVFVMLFFR